MDKVGELGIAAVVVLLILKEVFSFLKGRKPQPITMTPEITLMAAQVSQIHKNISENTFAQKSLKDAFDRLILSIDAQTNALQTVILTTQTTKILVETKLNQQ